jgi:hypothetical protein
MQIAAMGRLLESDLVLNLVLLALFGSLYIALRKWSDGDGARRQ